MFRVRIEELVGKILAFAVSGKRALRKLAGEIKLDQPI
jgi:hypothetical protein